MIRVEAIQWELVFRELDAEGFAIIKGILSSDECDKIRDLYEKRDIFRSNVVMERHGFGRGEYRYFSYPLPRLVAALRTSVYPHLVPIANRWNEAIGINVRYPAKHADYIDRCHQAGQNKPTPLLLKYGAGDYNCLHKNCMANTFSRSSSRSCCRSRTKILRAANLC